VVITGELGQLLDDDSPRRHVDADGQRLGGEHRAQQSGDEALLDRLLERRHHAGVVGGGAGFELGGELVVAEHCEIRLVESLESRVEDLPDRLALGTIGQAHAGIGHLAGGFPALIAAEDEVDRRKQVPCGQQVNGVQATRRVQHTLPAPPGGALPVTPASDRLGVDLRCVGVGKAADERRQEVQLVVRTVADEVVVIEAYRPPRLDDD
jgi:hypothetical protein